MSKPIYRFDADTIAEWFSYDPVSGLVRWKKKPNRNIVVGSVAGFRWYAVKGLTEYWRIGFRGQYVFAHQIAFVCMTGDYPIGMTDHENGDGLDNRWSNLRDVTHAANTRNRRRSRNNTSGAMGVGWHKATRKWSARIRTDKGEKHLGVFTTKDEAIAARTEANKVYGYHANHGR